MQDDPLLPAAYPPLRDAADIEAIERVPLAERIDDWDFASALLRGCDRDPGKTALSFIADGDVRAPAHEWRYADLRRHAVQVANLLRAQGIGADDAVAIVLPALPGLYAAVLGAFLAGRPFPVNWMLDARSLGELFRAAAVKAVVALPPMPGFAIWENVTAALDGLGGGIPLYTVGLPGAAPEPGATDLLQAASAMAGDRLGFERRAATANQVAAYVHSGGTTGTPKIVRLTHGGLVYRTWASNMGLALSPDDVVLADTPIFHIGGFCVRGLVPVADGMHIVIPSILGARDKAYIANYWKFVERFGITQLSGVPTTLSVLVRNPPQGEDVGSLRPIFSTGSTAIAPAVQREIEQVSGARPLVMYGLTENTSNVTIDPRDGVVKTGCSGIRVPYTRLRAVQMDEQGAMLRDCAPGEVGMLLVSGPGVAAGYVDARQDAGAFLSDGSFVTGDLGAIDGDGYVRIVGRRKDLIIRGGHNIDPSQIEYALMQAPQVALAAAVGKPDTHAGELPVAYVQLHEGVQADAESLRFFAAQRIPERVAVPKEIYIVDAIPLSSVGKPLKHRLQADAAERAFREALAPLGDRLRVQAGHEDGGLLVTVHLPGDDDALAAGVEAVLARFSVRCRIDRQPQGETSA